MILHVIGTDLKYKGRIENFKSLRWEENYGAQGKISLTVDDTEKNAALIKKGCLFYRADRKTAMIAVKITRNGERKTITVGGYTTLSVLGRRFVKGILSVKNLESGAYKAVQDNLRGLSPVALAAYKGYTEESELEFEDEDMIKCLETIVAAGELGMRMLFDYDQKTHIFEVYKGADRTYKDGSGGVVFSLEFGNMFALTIEEDDDIYRNVAVVKGTFVDEDGNETIEYMDVGVDGEALAEGMERREIFVSASAQSDEQTDDQYRAYLKTEGIKTLQDHYEQQTFKAQISPEALGKDYDLGDKVTCKATRYGLRFDTRITAFVELIESGTQSVSLTLGKPTVSYLKGAILNG